MASGPIFVKVDDYQQINDTVAQIKQRISESRTLLDQIEKLKREEDGYLQKWKAGIAELEKRTGNVDQLLYKINY